MADTLWRGMIAPLNVPTGDGRRFLSAGFTNRDLPLPLKWQRGDVEGHMDSVIVGSLEEINIGTVQEAVDSGWIAAKCIKKGMSLETLGAWGTGRFFKCNPQETPRLAEDVAEAILLTEQGVIGPSVDPGACEFVLARAGSDEPLSDDELDEIMYENEGIEVEIELLFTEYQVAAATLVGIPAFAECRPFEVISADMVVTAAVRSSGWDTMPFADRDLEWDGTQAERNVAGWSGVEGDAPDWERYKSAFLYQDDEANPETKGAYGFQIADLIDDALTIVPRAVFTVAGVLQGSMGGTKISQADQDAMKGVVERLYERMATEFEDPNIVAPWLSGDASLMFSTEEHVFDAALFADPELDTITPITVTDDGRVFGHVATHDVCHVGMPGVCTTAPVDDDGFRMFHRYQVPGVGEPVGRITVGHGEHKCSCRQCGGRNDDHACLKLSAGGAIAHHDSLSTVAWVRAGEDTNLNAIWVSGVINPEATVDDLSVLTRRKVSGDWRPVGGETTLVEVLALSREEPGFPLPRFRVTSSRVQALTAAGTVRVRAEAPELDMIDYDRLATLVANKINSKMGTIGLAIKEPESLEDNEVTIVLSGETIDETLSVVVSGEMVEEALSAVLSAVDSASVQSIMHDLKGI